MTPTRTYQNDQTDRLLKLCRSRHDSHLTQDRTSANAYRDHMSDLETDHGSTFGTLLRDARQTLGLTQDDVVAQSTVSRSTYLRWEKGVTTAPEPWLVRDVCQVLRLSPVDAAISLGYVTHEEVKHPPRDPVMPLEPVLAKLARVFADQNVPDRAKKNLRKGLTSLFEFWLDAFRYKTPVDTAAVHHTH
jgi:transcriptional regulator with XRE-family HTH domain